MHTRHSQPAHIKLGSHIASEANLRSPSSSRQSTIGHRRYFHGAGATSLLPHLRPDQTSRPCRSQQDRLHPRAAESQHNSLRPLRPTPQASPGKHTTRAHPPPSDTIAPLTCLLPTTRLAPIPPPRIHPPAPRSDPTGPHTPHNPNSPSIDALPAHLLPEPLA